MMKADSTSMSIALTSHVSARMSQRAISQEMIDCTMDFGEFFHRQGCVMYFLADRNKVIGVDAEVVRASRGLVVIASDDGVIITAYHNRKSGLKDLKKKDKINRKKCLRLQNNVKSQLAHAA
jgi:hypothetical protein